MTDDTKCQQSIFEFFLCVRIQKDLKNVICQSKHSFLTDLKPFLHCRHCYKESATAEKATKNTKSDNKQDKLQTL